MIWELLRFIGWRGAIAFALMIAAGVLVAKLNSANHRAEKLQDRLSVCEAQRDMARADNERMVEEGEMRSQRAAVALQEQERQSAVYRGQIGKLRSVRVPEGSCDTPAEVMESDL